MGLGVLVAALLAFCDRLACLVGKLSAGALGAAVGGFWTITGVLRVECCTSLLTSACVLAGGLALGAWAAGGRTPAGRREGSIVSCALCALHQFFRSLVEVAG